jgi:hypothetical protein
MYDKKLCPIHYIAFVKILIIFRVLAHAMLMLIFKKNASLECAYPKEFYRYQTRFGGKSIRRHLSLWPYGDEKVSMTGRIPYSTRPHAHGKDSYLRYVVPTVGLG